MSVPTPCWGLPEQRTLGSRARTHCLKGEKETNKTPHVPPPRSGTFKGLTLHGPPSLRPARGGRPCHTTGCRWPSLSPLTVTQPQWPQGAVLSRKDRGKGTHSWGWGGVLGCGDIGGEIWILRPGSDRVGVQALDSGGLRDKGNGLWILGDTEGLGADSGSPRRIGVLDFGGHRVVGCWILGSWGHRGFRLWILGAWVTHGV